MDDLIVIKIKKAEKLLVFFGLISYEFQVSQNRAETTSQSTKSQSAAT